MNWISWVGGFLSGASFALMMTVLFDSPKKKKKKIKLGRLYCFKCEIDMPVHEKKGDYYCSNCGLYHGTKI